MNFNSMSKYREGMTFSNLRTKPAIIDEEYMQVFLPNAMKGIDRSSNVPLIAPIPEIKSNKRKDGTFCVVYIIFTLTN